MNYSPRRFWLKTKQRKGGDGLASTRLSGDSKRCPRTKVDANPVDRLDYVCACVEQVWTSPAVTLELTLLGIQLVPDPVPQKIE